MSDISHSLVRLKRNGMEPQLMHNSHPHISKDNMFHVLSHHIKQEDHSSITLHCSKPELDFEFSFDFTSKQLVTHLNHCSEDRSHLHIHGHGHINYGLTKNSLHSDFCSSNSQISRRFIYSIHS